MKTLFVCGVFGEPYKLTIDDKLLNEVTIAQRTLKRLPWSGEMFLPIPIEPLQKNYQFKAEIVIRKNCIGIYIDGPESKEPVLDVGTDVLALPDIYVSNEFDMLLFDFIFSLKPDDIDLINVWREKSTKQKKFVNL